MILLLDSENADLDLTARVLCLTHTPNVKVPTLCKVSAWVGDGTKDHAAVDGEWVLDVVVGSQMVRKWIDVYGTISDRSLLESDPFVVPANTAVTCYLLSPDPSDTDVDVTASIYQVDEPAVAVHGTIDDASPTATDFDGASGLVETNDYYNGSFLAFVDGPAAGQWRQIRDYVGSTRNFLFTGDVFAAAPENGNRFIIVGNAPAAL